MRCRTLLLLVALSVPASTALADETATFGITAEMGRQYKAMQEGLLEKIGALEANIGRLKGELGEHYF